MPKSLLLLAFLSGPVYSAACAQSDSASRAWNHPVAPFRILGNVYYVGASDVTSFLIATSGGLNLLDGGLIETAPQILRNIRTLGFDPQNVRIILNSHAHYDHAGGLAAVKAATGGKLYAGRGDSALLARGGRQDFFFGDRFPYPAVTVDHAVRDNERVILGADTLVALATPGHTQGCTTWSMTLRASGTGYPTLFVCSLSTPGYPLRDNPPYPGIVEDYRASIRRLQALPCDVLLAPHGVQFELTAKAARLRAGAQTSPFIDPAGCRAYLDDAAKNIEAQMRK